MFTKHCCTKLSYTKTNHTFRLHANSLGEIYYSGGVFNNRVIIQLQALPLTHFPYANVETPTQGWDEESNKTTKL